LLHNSGIVRDRRWSNAARHAGGEPVLLADRGEELLAIGAACTHYGGPLAEMLLTTIGHEEDNA
jgi:nitrite reductase/ring-hydroxylating ferredoxin subunit